MDEIHFYIKWMVELKERLLGKVRKVRLEEPSQKSIEGKTQTVSQDIIDE